MCSRLVAANGVPFTGEGKLVRKATGYEQETLKPRYPTSGSRVPQELHQINVIFQARAVCAGLLSRLDFETCEVALGPRADPQCDTARGIAEFQIVHDQARLGGAVNI
jgi:hypothetical protein